MRNKLRSLLNDGRATKYNGSCYSCGKGTPNQAIRKGMKRSGSENQYSIV